MTPHAIRLVAGMMNAGKDKGVMLKAADRIAELEQELAIGVNVIRDYEERITELESDNRRMKKVMQRYIDSQDNAKNNWVLDFLQVLEK